MERYREVIEDFEKFKEYRNKEKLQTIRRNDLKTEEEFFEQELSEKFEYSKAQWNENIYRLNQDISPGKNWLHWRGDYYVQEESATLPAEVLNPQPGQKILDMCAAPGGKTTQMADKIDNKGLIIANDKSGNRLQSLHANIYRTGAVSVNITNYDGRNIPEDLKFDKILVDAPCTGEGDRYRRHFTPADKEESQNLAKLQKQLLEKASNLLKPGGEIVYSTCTITPLENEKVVDYIINNTDLSIQDIDTEIPYQKGVTSYKEKNFDSDLKKSIRVMPHHINSGVIYVAKLKK